MTYRITKKTILLGVIVFLVTLLGGIGIGYWSRAQRMRTQAPIQLGTQTEEVVSTDQKKQYIIGPSELAPVNPEETLAIARQKIAYETLLRQYRKRSIHVGADCRAVPRLITVAAGARILLDNQSDTEKTIRFEFDTEGFVLAPRHYVITNVPQSGSFMVGCDSNKNVATITIKQ